MQVPRSLGPMCSAKTCRDDAAPSTLPSDLMLPRTAYLQRDRCLYCAHPNAEKEGGTQIAKKAECANGISR